jgi:hypothetical protein
MVWNLLGDPDNFIEPFAGSAAVLLARPHQARIETINDERLAGHTGTDGRGVHDGRKFRQEGRPQLADAYSRGRGVHNDNHLSEQMPHMDKMGRLVHSPPDFQATCEQRRAWLVEWFRRLRDRLRTVRVCCGDWKRVCGSESVTTRLGVTGIFLDPPYSQQSGRHMGLYSQDCGKVAHEVREYCVERGSNDQMRIVLAGYEGEHNELEKHGWGKIEWKAVGGYGNQSGTVNENAKKERLWFSPFCVSMDMPLFQEPEETISEAESGQQTQQTKKSGDGTDGPVEKAVPESAG